MRSLQYWFLKSEVLRDSVGPVCAQYHQQPAWGCESWTQADRFGHNGFHKGLRQGTTQESITQIGLL